ncbi:MAG: helix-turn-helix domain-containing protein [Candidatus Aminicenantes bacterium]
MASVGQELKRERELRGISLKEIADSTKISLRLLKALEADQLDLLPGKFFTRGIIRAYSRYLGLDEEATLNMYHEQTQAQEQTVVEQKKNEKEFSLPKDVTKVLRYAVLIIILLLILFTVYHYLPKKEEPEALKPSLTPQLIEESPLPQPPPQEEELVPEEKGINLEITFVEETWIQVYADGELELDGLKYPGEKAEMEATEEFLIHLGNAGGLTYTLNNKEGKALGRSGEVVKNIKINSDNLPQYLASQDNPLHP